MSYYKFCTEKGVKYNKKILSPLIMVFVSEADTLPSVMSYSEQVLTALLQ
jgi:hypothetical protein